MQAWDCTGRLRNCSSKCVSARPSCRVGTCDGGPHASWATSTNTPVLVECLQQESDLQLTDDDVAGGLATAREAVRLAENVFAGSPLRQVAPRVQLAVADRLAGDL